MLYLACAAHGTAAPFLRLLKLKRDLLAARFEFFYTQTTPTPHTDAALCVTGTGALEAAANVAALLARPTPGGPAAPNEQDLFVWLGNGGPEGEVSVCTSVYAPDGRIFYPDLLFPHPFSETEETAPEAAGAFRATACFFPPHRAVFFRIGESGTDEAAARIVRWLRETEASLPAAPSAFTPAETALLARVRQAMRLTETPARELINLAAWHKLRGENLFALLGPAADAPVPDPNGRKAVFAALRERLLKPGPETAAKEPPEPPARENGTRGAFRHLYAERDALGTPAARDILARFPQAKMIPVGHYKDIFCRAGQDFAAQRRSRQLILAVQHGALLYPGAPVCPDFGHAHFYYASSVLNCPFDCAYCYLQGMYPSANLVVFVNLEETFAAVDRLLAQFPVYLCISYDTDLLALESVCGFVVRWAEFARARPSLTVELRTKSGDASALACIPPMPNFIPAWTLSPDRVARMLEPGAPSLSARLRALHTAARAGWKVRLCFDPLLDIPGAPAQYAALVKQTFTTVPPDAVRDVSIGVFRIAKSYLRALQRRRPDAEPAFYPYVCENGVCTYPPERRTLLTEAVCGAAESFVGRGRIFVQE